ncbi:uncharacterized protein LOC134840033 [Symsagittifera roscoffensis]|uniref:uncharacterized protein LOC134840033 n=1 Tax=Symsagittifera roscoffensis TaxID=84072 RepID=UPI00307B55DE
MFCASTMHRCSCALSKARMPRMLRRRSISVQSSKMLAKNNPSLVPYDTHNLHKALVGAGFSEEQAEVMNNQLKSVVVSSTVNYEEHFSQLDSLAEDLTRKVARIEQLEKEVALLEKGTVQVLRSENQKLTTDINAFHSILKEDLQKYYAKASYHDMLRVLL